MRYKFNNKKLSHSEINRQKEGQNNCEKKLLFDRKKQQTFHLYFRKTSI